MMAQRMVSKISQAVKKRPSGSSLKRSSVYILRRSFSESRRYCASASARFSFCFSSSTSCDATLPPCASSMRRIFSALSRAFRSISAATSASSRSSVRSTAENMEVRLGSAGGGIPLIVRRRQHEAKKKIRL